MANPRVQDGYTEIANELLDAIIRTSMTDYEHRIFWLILRKTYGMTEIGEWIERSQIAQATGITRLNIIRALNNLHKRKIIMKFGQALGIQEDYDRWETSINNKSNPDKTKQKKKYGDQHLALDKEINEIFKNMKIDQ